MAKAIGLIFADQACRLPFGTRETKIINSNYKNRIKVVIMKKLQAKIGIVNSMYPNQITFLELANLLLVYAVFS